MIGYWELHNTEMLVTGLWGEGRGMEVGGGGRGKM